jgi:thiol-disulfide isomerase/thioredoxin
MQVGMKLRLRYLRLSQVALLGLALIGCDNAKPQRIAADKEVAEADVSSAEQSVLPTPPTEQKEVRPTETQQIVSTVNTQQVDGPSSQGVEESSVTRVINQTDFTNSTFMTLRPPQSDQPQDLVVFLGQVDSALRDLIIAGSNNIVDSETFTQSGMRLGRMKLEAGEKLSQLPAATDEHRKTGTIAQLVALSHMSGLKDVESAKKLEKLASSLMQSSDPDLAHQGHVVSLGFRLQELQNGISTDPEKLLAELKGLFQRPKDSGFPEMMILQQAQQVLTQMGFDEAADKIDGIVVDKYMDAADVQLSMAAWGIAAAKSQAFANYNAALQDVYNGKMDDPTLFLGAVRGLYQELPNTTTLIQFASAATDIEYRGGVDVASALGDFVREQLSTHPVSAYTEGIVASLDAQQRRLSIRGREVKLQGLVDLEGKPLDWTAYRGKVVLLDFWATWCTPCLREIPNIRKVYEDQHSQGFEVIGINMDDDLNPVRQYLASNPLPWKTMSSADPSALGFKSEIAQELGITAIPFLVLIDTQGKVAGIHVRGDRLGPSVATMLNPLLSN